MTALIGFPYAGERDEWYIAGYGPEVRREWRYRPQDWPEKPPGPPRPFSECVLEAVAAGRCRLEIYGDVISPERARAALDAERTG